jgi:branched-chain amino acid transport system permease protein
MNQKGIAALAGLGVLLALPFVTPAYFLHLLIQILLWGFIYTAWSMMGRFGLVSLGHGAFMGLGAYVPALLWNYFDLTPWLGIPVGIVLSALLGLIIGYPCFHLKVVGHYFALVTLALSQIVLLSIVAARDITGGSLGLTPRSIGHSWYALQFPDKGYFYAIALVIWLGGLFVWHWIDRGIGREALEAISDDEDAAAAIGIDVTREKLRVTIISAALTALGGAVFGQYLMYLNPETFSGIGVSLQIVFAAIAGGMYAMLGPTVGSLFTIALTEGLRVWFGASFVGAANTIYGILLILFIIFMPRGILGLFETTRSSRTGAAASARPGESGDPASPTAAARFPLARE